MKSELKLRCSPKDAAYDPALLDCRPEENAVTEKLEQFAKRNTRYIEGGRVEKGAILRLELSGGHPLCRNRSVEIAEGYHLFCAALEDAMDGASVGDTVTVETEEGTLHARIVSVQLPRQEALTDAMVRAAGIPSVSTVPDFRDHVRRELAEKNRARNRVLIYAQRSEDLIARGEIWYDEAERQAWITQRLAAEKARMRVEHTDASLEAVWALNEETLANHYRARFDQGLLECALSELGGIPADAPETDKRDYAKRLLLDELPFIME